MLPGRGQVLDYVRVCMMTVAGYTCCRGVKVEDEGEL